MKAIFLARLLSVAIMPVAAVLCLGRPAWAMPFEWQSATPESEGMSKERLDALKDQLAGLKTRAFLANRHWAYASAWLYQRLNQRGEASE